MRGLLVEVQLCRHSAGNDSPHAFAYEEQLLILRKRANGRFAFLGYNIDFVTFELSPCALIAVFQQQDITAIFPGQLGRIIQQRTLSRVVLTRKNYCERLRLLCNILMSDFPAPMRGHDDA
ncbi:hypothetical protein D3C74_338560 [compost metagenome]